MRVASDQEALLVQKGAHLAPDEQQTSGVLVRGGYYEKRRLFDLPGLRIGENGAGKGENNGVGQCPSAPDRVLLELPAPKGRSTALHSPTSLHIEPMRILLLMDQTEPKKTASEEFRGNHLGGA